MFKTIVSFTLLFITLFVFAGCQKTGTVNNTGTSSNTGTEPTVAVQPAPKASEDVRSIIAFIVDKRNAKKFLAYKRYGGDSVQVVFNHKGNRYTVFYSGRKSDFGDVIRNPWVAFWVRPIGTSNQQTMETFSVAETGSVVLGLTGKGKTTGPVTTNPENKLFSDLPDVTSIKRGLEYRDYWQERADLAIPTMLEYINKQKS